MTKKKVTAPADAKMTPVAKNKHNPQTKELTGTLRPVKRGDTTAPNLFTKDDAPKKGSRIKFKVKGKAYSAIVAQTFEADGETAISFKGSIEVAK